MLLPLLGACAVVGPFQGPEWEPVRGLLTENHSCRDPRCCGNLLVLCLFLIWQVRHYWHQVTRTTPSTRRVTKVSSQKWAVPVMRHDTCFGLISKLFFGPGNKPTAQGLNAHVQQCAPKKRWGYRRTLQESRAQYLFSWQYSCQRPPWDFHTPSESTVSTTSLSSTSLLPQDSSWDVWQASWCLDDEHTHLTCKPLLPDLDMHQRMEQLLVYSQEESVPLEPVVRMRSHPTSMTLATSLPNLPSSQRLQFCSREFLPFPSNQQVGIPTWKSWGCPQEAWAPGKANLTLGRKDIRETQALEWANQRESSGEDAWEIQATERQLPTKSGMKNNVETNVLEWGSQRLVTSKTHGEILTPEWENQDKVGVENRAKIQELGKRNQREVGDENAPVMQAHIVENKKELKCKIDAGTQTPEWWNQDKSRDENAVETQAFEKNKKEARGEDEGATHAQGLGKQGQTGSKNGEEFQVPRWRKQDRLRGDIGTEIQVEERRNKDQVGGGNAVQTQVSGRENLGEVGKEDGIETQALRWGKQECVGSENVTAIQTPAWEKSHQGESEGASKIQELRGEIQKRLRHEFQAGWGSQGPRREKDAGETQITRRTNLREIREEDWIVIHALWWTDQKPGASEVDREFEISCWGNQDQIGGEHRAEIQVPEKRNQRKDRDEDCINTLAPEAEKQEQLKGETHVDVHPPGRNHEVFGDETRTDIQLPGKRNPRGFKGENGKETQELREENQSPLSNEINGKIHTPKWKNQEYIRGKNGANTQVSEVESWGKFRSKIDGETQFTEWKKEEQAGSENGIDIKPPEKRNQREAGGEAGTETWTPGKENQSQLRGDIAIQANLPEWKNQEQMDGENGTEIQVPEKRNQRESGGEDGTETHRPERGENLGQLDSEIEESHSPGRRNCEQIGGKNDAENQLLEKRNQREVGSEDGRKIQRFKGGNWRLLKSKVNGKTCSLEWKNQEQIGGEDGAEIQTQGKGNLRGTTADDGREIQAPGEDCQRQLRSQIDEEVQTQGQGHQNKGGDEDAAEIWDVASQRKCKAVDAGGPGIPRDGNKDQVRGKDAPESDLQVYCSESEGPPALTGSGYGAMEQEQEQALASPPCPEMKPLPHQGDGEHLASQSMAPARKHRVGINPASRQAPPKPQRSRQRDKQVDPGKVSGLAWQLQNPQSLAALRDQPSFCPSDSCGQTPQAATALAGSPIPLTVMPKWPVLKKSQRLLLESLMRRRMAHLKWGLPQRILESHSLFNVLGPCPLPFAGVQLPGLYTACELQRQQEKLHEAQGPRPGLRSTERSKRVRLPERKSSIQARALEKCGPQGADPMGISTHPPKPRRVRPPGGPREGQGVQKKAPPRPKPPAPRKPRLASKSQSWCGQESIQESSRENSRGRKMVRPGVSQMADRPPSRIRTSHSRAGHNYWSESTSQEASKPPKLKCQQPTHWRGGSLESVEGRGAEQQPSCSTDASSFKGNLHYAAARLNTTFLNKISWFPHLAKPQPSALDLSPRGSDPTPLLKVVDPSVREDSTEVHTPLKRDLQPPGHCCAGATLPKTESLQGQQEPENPNRAPRNLPASKKFGFAKYLRCFLLQHCFRK